MRPHRPPKAKRVLPTENSIRGATAQHLATVRPENKVCRVCGSHPEVRAGGPNAASMLACVGLDRIRKVRTEVRTEFAGLHSRRAKTARVENSMLVGVCRGSTPANHEIGHRDMGRKGLQNLDPLGRRSDHPIHPLASVIVRQHHVQAELLAQHPGNRPAHGVRLPASGQHQLQAGRPLRTA